MRKISTGSKLRRRGRMARSRAMILAWARKQKQKNLCHPVSIPLRVPLVCPLIGCNGTGHVNGIDLAHVTLSGCPNYHNLPFEKWAEMRAREDGFVSPVQLHSRDPIGPIGSPNKTAKCVHSVERSHQFRTLMKEPSLDELATPVEIYQFRCSQQRLLVDKEHEAKEHLILCARIASLRSTAFGNRGLDGSRTQPHKSNHHHKPHSVEHTGAALKQRISSVIFGDWQIEPTYLSDYPPDIACLPTIYVCEYCLAPMPFSITYERHRNECTWRSPPGKLIYQKDKLIFYEVDGEQDPDYCRNLCLLTKLFLKHKTVHELDQVPSFLFYILTETDADGSHILGYFSKQKPEDSHDTSSTTVSYNNLSCILILPPYQCHGYGRMLIELSYTLSLLENRIGTPERPLSDPGLILYRKYWKWEILHYLASYQEKTINMYSMSQALGIAIPDIVSTLLDMKMLAYFRTQYYIVNNKAEVNRLIASMRAPDPSRCIDRNCLHWTPHSVAPSMRGGRGSSKLNRSTVSVEETSNNSAN